MRGEVSGKDVSWVSYGVGTHKVWLSCAAGRWSVRLDEVTLERWYTTQTEAWEAGVRAADRIDRQDAA